MNVDFKYKMLVLSYNKMLEATLRLLARKGGKLNNTPPPQSRLEIVMNP